MQVSYDIFPRPPTKWQMQWMVCVLEVTISSSWLFCLLFYLKIHYTKLLLYKLTLWLLYVFIYRISCTFMGKWLPIPAMWEEISQAIWATQVVICCSSFHTGFCKMYIATKSLLRYIQYSPGFLWYCYARCEQFTYYSPSHLHIISMN